MSKVCKSNLTNKCSHRELVIGNRGANCLDCGCFLYSQVDNYSNKAVVTATVNLKEDYIFRDIIPFEYYDSLVKDEIFERKSNKHKSENKLIDYIIELGDRFKQRNLTIHIAVEYLDLALAKYSEILLNRIKDQSKVDTKEDHSNLWAIVSLILASKYDEIDKRIPFYCELKRASSRASLYTIKEFRSVEEFFIKAILNWDFKMITTLHFAYCFISQGILFEDDNFDSDGTQILKLLRRKTEFFTDLSLDCDQLNKGQYSKSKIGTACIVASRKICSIKPLWNNKLYNMTGYHFFDIKDILEILIQEYCSFYNEEYSQIMKSSKSKRTKVQQRPQSFVRNRDSEKSKLRAQLTHIQSAKSLKISESIGISSTRNTICEKLTSLPLFGLNSSINNFDIKSIKLDALEGDNLSSSISIPDENEIESDPSEQIKLEKIQNSNSKVSENEEFEPIKIYIMKFKCKNEHELSTKCENVINPIQKQRFSSLPRIEKGLLERNSDYIEKPFENAKFRSTTVKDCDYCGTNNSDSSCKAKKVHDSLFNSNCKIILNKAIPIKCSLKQTKEVFRNLQNKMKLQYNSSFNNTMYTSPKMSSKCALSYLNQKSRDHMKNAKGISSNSKSKYFTKIRQPYNSYYNQSNSQSKYEINFDNQRLILKNYKDNYVTLRASCCNDREELKTSQLKHL